MRVLPQVEFSGALPSPRCFHTAVVLSGRMVVFGGARLTRDTWEYFEHLYSFRLAASPDATATAPRQGQDLAAAHESKSLAEDLGGLLGSEDFADVAFVVEGRRVLAHKAVLCARCDYFRHMLHSGMAETRQKDITLPDIRYKAFKGLLQYIYTDRVMPSADIAVDLMALASRYGMEGLKARVEQRIMASITVENVSSILAAADLHAAEELKRCCMDYMLKEFGHVITSSSFVALASDHPELAKEALAAASKNMTFAFR
jgi:hypothetical protein